MEAMHLGHLAVWRHPAKGEPKGRFITIHGISEHSGRHLPTFRALNNQGFEVVRFDLRGAGLSGGKRQYIDTFSDYVNDVATVSNWVAGTLDPMPLFIMGHSMGGAIAITFASLYGTLFHGLVLSAPGFRVGQAISPLKILLGRIVVRVLPTLRLHSDDHSALSRDPDVIEAYKRDPLASRFNTLRQGEQVLEAFRSLPEKCRKITNPTLIYHGTHDRVIQPGGSFELFQSLASTHRELHYLPGGYHEPHLDLDKEAVFQLLCRWAARQLPSNPARLPRNVLDPLELVS